jgi:AhpD family alkylhydroperoxidase
MATMAVIKLVEEDEASGAVRDVYQDIKSTLGIDFVPNMYRAMGNDPDYLASSWNKIQAVMGGHGKLDGLTKDIIALTVSVMSGCDYCIGVYMSAVRNGGLDDQAILELLAVVDTYRGLNQLNIGLQLEPDERPWYGCAGKVPAGSAS